MRLHQLTGGGGQGSQSAEAETEVDGRTTPSQTAQQWLKVPIRAASDGAEHVRPASHSLAQIPALPISAARWGLVDHEFSPPGTGQAIEVVALGELGAFSDWGVIVSDVLVVSHPTGGATLLAQGTVPIAYLPVGQPIVHVIWAGPGQDLMVFVRDQQQLRAHCLSGPLANPALARTGVDAATQVTLATTLRHLLAYTLDVLYAMRQAWNRTFVPAAQEWQTRADEVRSKFSVNWKLELMVAMAGGRMGDGLSHVMLSEINENVRDNFDHSTDVC